MISRAIIIALTPCSRCVSFAGGPSWSLPMRGRACRRGFRRWINCCLVEDWNVVRSWNGWSPSRGAEPAAWRCRESIRPCNSGRPGRSWTRRGNFIPPRFRDGGFRWSHCCCCVPIRWPIPPGPWSNVCGVRRSESPGFKRKPFPNVFCSAGRSRPKQEVAQESCSVPRRPGSKRHGLMFAGWSNPGILHGPGRALRKRGRFLVRRTPFPSRHRPWEPQVDACL